MRQVIGREQVQALVGSGARLIDVLPSSEYERGHLAGAINIPLARLSRATVEAFAKTEPLIVYCYDLQ